MRERERRTGFIFFIKTGRPETTRDTWIWTAEATGKKIGTWRTSNGGRPWKRVDSNEHPHGQMQIYQPDSSGLVFMTWTGTCPGSGTLPGNEKCTASTTTNRYSIQRQFKTSQFESVRSIRSANS